MEIGIIDCDRKLFNQVTAKVPDPVWFCDPKDAKWPDYFNRETSVLVMNTTLLDQPEELVQRFKDEDPLKKLIVLSSLKKEKEKEKWLVAGADAVLALPTDRKELIDLILAYRERCQRSYFQNELLIFEDIVVDLTKRTVKRSGIPIRLSISLYKLLLLFIRNKEIPINKQRIAAYLWGDTFERQTNSVETTISRLRKKIDVPFPLKVIHTRKGYGYVMTPGRRG